MFDKCQRFFSKTVKYDANIWILFTEDTNRYLRDKQKLKKSQCLQLSYICTKIIDNPLDCKEIQPVHSEGDQPWDFFGGNDAEAKISVLWPPHAKRWLIGKDCDAGRVWRQEEKGTTEDEMAGWHHWLNGRESEWTPGDGDGQGGLACCDSWGHKELDTTEWLNWTKLNRKLYYC